LSAALQICFGFHRVASVFPPIGAGFDVGLDAEAALGSAHIAQRELLQRFLHLVLELFHHLVSLERRFDAMRNIERIKLAVNTLGGVAM
jgi:hypothetical protein